MDELNLYTLKIKPLFRDLIPPLSVDEFNTLEENIISKGCINPIVTWEGYIIDGHNRYKICHKHKIPFKTVELSFHIEEEAISWICDNQIGRRNISPETRKYLIGKRYLAEKVIGATNKCGFNQHKKANEVGARFLHQPQPSNYRTNEKIGQEYKISHTTVTQYRIFSQEIDKLSELNSVLADNVLSGKLKLSYNKLHELCNLDKAELSAISEYVLTHSTDNHYVTYSDIKNLLQELRQRKTQERAAIPPPSQRREPFEISIKNLPEYDPDAEVTSLSLTIPSWVGSINRASNNCDLSKISEQARNKLKDEMFKLHNAIFTILQQIEEAIK